MKNKILAALVGTLLMQSFSVPAHAQALEQFAGNQKITGNHPDQVRSRNAPLELQIVGSKSGDTPGQQSAGIHNINFRLAAAKQVNSWPCSDSGRRAADLLVTNAKSPKTIVLVSNHPAPGKIPSAALADATSTNRPHSVSINNFPGSNLDHLQKLPSSMGAMIGCGFRISANDAPYISEYANQNSQGSKSFPDGTLVHRSEPGLR